MDEGAKEPDGTLITVPAEIDKILEGKWKLEKQLGQGGMGTVYQARDLNLDRIVAIKVLSPQLAKSPELRARFEREAKVMARLEHPNLVPIYAWGVSEEGPFIVMKLLEGSTLQAFLKERDGRLDLSEFLGMAEQLCNGVGFIHAKGLIHRDLKPANIFISPEGQVTVLDLGVARQQQGENMTRTGVLVGTPAYMSPEQVLGSKDIDHRSDLYSLGVILFQILTGRPPFTGESDFTVMMAHRSDPVPDPCTLVEGLPAPVGVVICTALAKAKEERFQTARELFAALKAGFQGLDITLPAAPPVTKKVERTPARIIQGPSQEAVATIAPLDLRGVSGVRAPPPVAPRSLLPWVVLGALTLIIVAGGSWLVWSARQNEPQRLPDSETRAPPATPASKAQPVPPAVAQRPADDPKAQPTPPPVAEQPAGEPKAQPAVAERPAGEPRAQPPVAARPAGEPKGQPAPEPVAARPAEPAKAPQPTAVAPAAPARPHRVVAAAPAPEAAKDGQLRITTSSKGARTWAWLDIDGNRKGATPLSIKLPPGRHAVRLERPGFQAVEREVRVPAGQTVVLQIDLTP